MAIKPFLQLVRLPNLFTAAADSLAGYLLVRGSLEEPRRWLPLAGASVAIYAGGIALNDAFDVEVDRRERPARPLPSGKLSLNFAMAFGAAAMLGGLGLVSLVSRESGIVAILLICAVILYDAGVKRTPLGPAIMGSCRGLNLLLGLSVAPDFGGPWAWLAAGSVAVFVAGLTVISRTEVEAGRAWGVGVGSMVQGVGLLGLFAVALHSGAFPGTAGSRPIVPVEGLLVLAMVGLVVASASGRAVVDPRPETKQRAVKTAVLSLVWIDVGLVAAVRGPGPALAVASLWVPAFLLGKWLYST